MWASQFTVAAGEDIRYLARDQAQDVGLPNHDYWLFNSRKLVRMLFDDADQFLGGEVIEDPAVIVQHNYWRDAAWHHPDIRGRALDTSDKITSDPALTPTQAVQLAAQRTRNTSR